MLQNDSVRDLLKLPQDEHLKLAPNQRLPPYNDRCFNIYESWRWWWHVTIGVGPVLDADHQDASFAEHENKIILSLTTDGFQPWHTSGGFKGTYSITPISCMILNLPENLRHRPEFM